MARRAVAVFELVLLSVVLLGHRGLECRQRILHGAASVVMMPWWIRTVVIRPTVVMPLVIG